MEEIGLFFVNKNQEWLNTPLALIASSSKKVASVNIKRYFGMTKMLQSAALNKAGKLCFI